MFPNTRFSLKTVTKQVGSTFKSALNKKYALLKARAILNNVTVYPTSKVFCQVQTTVTSLSGEKRCVYFGGSIPLEQILNYHC